MNTLKEYQSLISPATSNTYSKKRKLFHISKLSTLENLKKSKQVTIAKETSDTTEKILKMEGKKYGAHKLCKKESHQ